MNCTLYTIIHCACKHHHEFTSVLSLRVQHDFWAILYMWCHDLAEDWITKSYTLIKLYSNFIVPTCWNFAWLCKSWMFSPEGFIESLHDFILLDLDSCLKVAKMHWKHWIYIKLTIGLGLYARLFNVSLWSLKLMTLLLRLFSVVIHLCAKFGLNKIGFSVGIASGGGESLVILKQLYVDHWVT